MTTQLRSAQPTARPTRRPPSRHPGHRVDQDLRPPGRGHVVVVAELVRRQEAGGRRRPKAAADDVSFSVAPGEFFVIMGLSGSGKSTVLRMLNRLIEPTSGELLIGGRNVATMPEDELREAAQQQDQHGVPALRAVPPPHGAGERRLRAARPPRVARPSANERADWALKTVGLGDWGDALPGELSGGMRQRVGLARALASDADILLMDEPFSALDPLIRRDMQDLLMTLQRDLQRTVVFVTHDLNEAMRMGDRIMIMRNGKVVQLGTAQEILNTPADDYVVRVHLRRGPLPRPHRRHDHAAAAGHRHGARRPRGRAAPAEQRRGRGRLRAERRGRDRRRHPRGPAGRRPSGSSAPRWVSSRPTSTGPSTRTRR